MYSLKHSLAKSEMKKMSVRRHELEERKWQ